MDRNRTDRLSLVAGGIAGIGAWLLGYAITYLIVAPEVRESPLHQVIEALDGEPATYEMVGWVFYNAHFVNTVFRDVPLFGGYATSFVGGQDGFAFLLYGIPIVLLVTAGFGLARYRAADTPTEGALAGVSVLPGYLLCSMAGVFLFEVTLGQARAAPDLLSAILLAGIVAPAVWAGAGGAIEGYRAWRAGAHHEGEFTAHQS